MAQRAPVCVSSLIALCAVLLLGAPAVASADCGPTQAGYPSLVLAAPDLRAYWGLDETTGPVACDRADGDDGTYGGVYSLGHAGALPDDTGLLLSGDGTISVPSSAALNP